MMQPLHRALAASVARLVSGRLVNFLRPPPCHATRCCFSAHAQGSLLPSEKPQLWQALRRGNFWVEPLPWPRLRLGREARLQLQVGWKVRHGPNGSTVLSERACASLRRKSTAAPVVMS